MAAALKIPSIFTAIDKFSAPLRKMGRGMKDFAKRSEVALSRVERRVRKLTPSFRGLKNAVGSFGLILGGAAIIGAMTSAIGVYADFEQANASLSAVMSSATGPQLIALQADAKRLGATTSKTATEVVGLQESLARLGFEAPDIINMTGAILDGSVAMNAELARTADLTGAMIRTFDNLESQDTGTVIDQMTLATQKSALNFEKLETALPIVAGAANAAGIPFTKMTALLGKLSDSGIDASSSATALRNIFIDSAKKGLSYEQILEQIQKNQDKLTAANDKFGKRGAISAVVLAKNLAGVEKLNKELIAAAGAQEGQGVAAIAAKKQLDTLKGSITIMGSAYEGFILSLESGKGPFANLIKTAVQVATVLLAVANGSDDAKKSVAGMGNRVLKIAELTLLWGKRIGVVIGVIVAMNVALKIWRAGLIAFNIVQGIATALQGGNAFALRGSAIAMRAYGVVTSIMTGAQWLLNAALTANPIGLIIVGIAALIALVTIIILKYNKWGAALTLLLGPIGTLINLIQSFRRNWDLIKQTFKEGGILAGFKAIGATILDSILMPLQQVFQLMTNLPGVGEFASKAVSGLQEVRESLGVNLETDESGNKLVNPEAAAESARISREERIEKQTGTLTIENKTEKEASLEGSFSALQVQLSSTQGF